MPCSAQPVRSNAWPDSRSAKPTRYKTVRKMAAIRAAVDKRPNYVTKWSSLQPRSLFNSEQQNVFAAYSVLPLLSYW